MALAQPGDVLVAETTRWLIESRELAFVDRGEALLKGVTGPKRVLAAS
jgi:class 3 adenylate cyclase